MTHFENGPKPTSDFVRLTARGDDVMLPGVPEGDLVKAKDFVNKARENLEAVSVNLRAAQSWAGDAFDPDDALDSAADLLSNIEYAERELTDQIGEVAEYLHAGRVT